MSNTLPDSTTEDEFNPTHWDDFVWNLGCRTHSLGEYVMKLGDRIHGDTPMGLKETHHVAYAWGRREGAAHGPDPIARRRDLELEARWAAQA